MMFSLNRSIVALSIFLVVHPNFVRSYESTSLYVPGFDSAPLSASVLGVDGDGHTTWALFDGQPEATTDTLSYGDFGTATLVEGSVDAFLTYSNSAAHLTIAESCTLTESALAVCKVVAQGSTATQTEVVSYVPVQVWGTSSDPMNSKFTSTSTSSKARTSASASSTSAAPGSSDVIPSRTETFSDLPTTSSSSHRFRRVSSWWHIITFQISMLVLFFSMP